MTHPAPLLHLDWIQLQVKWYNKLEPVFASFYQVKKLAFSTRHFKEIYEVSLNGKRLATVTAKPLSGILNPDAIIVKFDNWVCYSLGMRKYISDFLQYNKFEFVSFSRLDFCADFNQFDNGMLPQKFVKKYLSRKLLRLGKTLNVAHNFKQGKKEHEEKGLKFGSNLSEATTYIYNKTLEMNQIVWKPHIYESWIKGGLDIERDVWRLEVSLKSGSILTANTETGEVDLFLTLDVLQYEFIYKCFYKLTERYFTFVWNDGQVRRDRMRKLKLFNYTHSPEVLIHAERLADADRSKRIFIKKLHELNNELRGKDFFMSIYMEEFKTALIEESHLQTWAMYRGINIAKSVKSFQQL